MKPCIKLLSDPLDNNVLVEDSLCCGTTAGEDDFFETLQNVIVDPAFIIEVDKEELFYFRALDWDTNFLIEARAGDTVFIVRNIIKNPTIDYISQLLRKGRLFSF
jgi:hypothetical protein